MESKMTYNRPQSTIDKAKDTIDSFIVFPLWKSDTEILNEFR